MPKRTPEEIKAEALEVEDFVTTARQKPLNFALLIATEGVVLKAHPTKETDTLWRQAKTAGGGAKGAMGVMNVSGKVIELTCSTDDFPTSLPRQAKAHLKDLGILMRVQMVLPNGAVLFDGDDDQPGQGAVPGQEGGADGQGGVREGMAEGSAIPKGVLRRAELLEELRELVSQAKALSEKDPERGAKVVAALRIAQSQLAENEFDNVVKAIEAIRKALIPPPPPMGPQPAAPQAAPPKPEEIEAERQKLLLAMAALADNTKLFIKRAEPSLAGKVKQLADAFTAGINGPDLKRMAQVVLALKNFLDAHLPNLPPVSKAEAAKDAIAAAKGQPVPPARYAKSNAIAAKYPGGAAAAKTAYDGFAAVLGDQPVTPQLLKDAKDDIGKVTGELAAPQKRLKDAQALPPGQARDQAIAAAQADIDAVQAKIDAAIAFEKAARGKVALDEALSYGPLSGASAKKMKDGSAAKLIAAFARNPELATAGLGAATTGKYPDAVADGIDGVLTAREGAFAGNGKKFADPAQADDYGKQLLAMGGNVGPEYFARMDGYLKSGRQFELDPMGDAAVGNNKRKAQLRSVSVAKGLLKPDGTVDVASDAAKQAVGDLLFSPIALAKPMPGLNEHVLKTVNMLADPGTKGKANTILSGMAAPTGGSTQLVQRAVGKTGAVNQGDARIAVMASMLKSMDQGDVGSCFSTASVRKLRETDPMGAMQMYADVATKGTVKPANSPEVPVVTRIEANEDPIMRSAEYSLAASIATKGSSREREVMQQMTGPGMDLLGDKVVQFAKESGFGKGVLAWLQSSGTKKAMKQQLGDAFDYVYDPTVATGSSADGSSSHGRYVLVRKDTKQEIRTQAEFMAVVKKVAVGASGFDDASPEARKLRAIVDDPNFPSWVKASNASPWELISGGYGEPASQAVFGSKMKSNKVTEKGTGTDNEGARTADVVTKLLTGLDGTTGDMVTLETVGQHAFNALPKDPSLAKLLAGGKGKIAENVTTHLVDKGRTLASANLPVEQAQAMFDKLMKDFEAANGDPTAVALLKSGARTHRPTAAMTPAQVDRAVADASDGFLGEIAKGRTDPVKAKADFKKWASDKVRDEMFREIAVEEFVIADTNWGGEESHTFFVVAPDPFSGEPKMWQKTVPPGSMRPAGRDWVDREWTVIK